MRTKSWLLEYREVTKEDEGAFYRTVRVSLFPANDESTARIEARTKWDNLKSNKCDSISNPRLIKEEEFDFWMYPAT